MSKILLLLLPLINAFIQFVRPDDIKSPCSEFYYGKIGNKDAAFLHGIIHPHAASNFTIDLEFYLPDGTPESVGNVNNGSNEQQISINLMFNDDKHNIKSICAAEPITFIVNFPKGALSLAEIHYPSNDCRMNYRRGSTTRITQQYGFDIKKLSEECDVILKDSGINDKWCGRPGVNEGTNNFSAKMPWIVSVLAHDRPEVNGVLISKTRVITHQIIRNSFEVKQPKDIKVQLYNGQILKIWKYEAAFDLTMLYLWPDTTTANLIPACLYVPYEMRIPEETLYAGFNKIVKLNSSTLCDKSCGTKSINSLRSNSNVCNSCYNCQICMDRKPDRTLGGALMYRIQDKWYFRGDLGGEDRFSDITSYLKYILERRGRGSSKFLYSVCRKYFEYGKEDEKDVGFIQIEVPQAQVYTFNLTVEFYIPNDVQINKDKLQIKLKERVSKGTNRNLMYVIYFPLNVLPLKRILFENQVACEGEINEHNPVVSMYHELITDPIISAEYNSLIKRGSIDEPECGVFNEPKYNSSFTYPWVAYVIDDNSKCFATLISRSVAVAATNCIEYLNGIKDNLTLRLFNNEIIKVAHYIKHPKYRSIDWANNIILLMLETEVTADGFAPACLWNYNFNDITTATGKHMRHRYVNQSDANVSVAHKSKCDLRKRYFRDNSLCVHYLDAAEACSGGKGAFMYKMDNKWYLRAVHSATVEINPNHRWNPCLTDHEIFTDVTQYYNWFINVRRSESLRSPCPEQFQYGEENGKNAAFLEVSVLRSQIDGFNVSLEFFVLEDDSDDPLNITLKDDETLAVQKILTRGRILYVVLFPDRPLTLMRIDFSGKIICENLHENFGSNPRIKKVHHEFKTSLDAIAEFNNYIGEGVNEDGCGNINRNYTSLSKGGEKVSRRSWPWVASLYIMAEHKCSASLITKSVAITAAHCVQFGGVTLRPSDVSLKLFNNRVAKLWGIILHPDFEPPTTNDIALLLLDVDITSIDFIPICVWPFHGEIENLHGTIVSYGETEVQVSGSINQLDITAVSSKTCRSSDEKLKKLANENTFCAKGPESTGPCQGDSGGGFIFKQYGRWYLRGTVSSSLKNQYNECDTDNYAVFMDIEKYFGWIQHSNKTMRRQKTDGGEYTITAQKEVNESQRHNEMIYDVPQTTNTTLQRKNLRGRSINEHSTVSNNGKIIFIPTELSVLSAFLCYFNSIVYKK